MGRWADGEVAQLLDRFDATGRQTARRPVWGVWIDGVLYFSSDAGSRKARNLAANPEVVAHLESGDDCVILEGQVEAMADREQLLALGVGKAYTSKYPPIDPFEDGGMFGVWFSLRPRTVFAWLEKDFPNTATRWDFEV